MTSQRGRFLLLGAILLGGFLLRWQGINDRVMWFDEAFSFTLTSQFSPSEVVERTAQDVHPPFYYLVLWCWIRVFGTSLVAMRGLSVLFGVAAIAMAYCVMAEAERTDQASSASVSGVGLGLIAAALLAVAPVHIRWSGEIRMYSLLSFLLLLSAWLALKAMSYRETSFWYWGGFSFSSAALLYTHNYGVFSFIALGAFVLFATAQSGQVSNDNVETRSLLGRFRTPHFIAAASTLAVSCWLFLPWIPVLLEQRSRVQADYWIPPLSWHVVAASWGELFFPAQAFQSNPTRDTLLLVGTGLLLLALQFGGRRADRLTAALAAIPFCIAIGISLASVPIIVDRMLLLAHLAAILALARGVYRLGGSGLGRWVLTGVLLFDSLWINVVYKGNLNIDSKPGVRGAAEYTLLHRNDDEPIFAVHPCVYFGIKYYVQGRASVRLCTPPGNITHYTGGPILTPDDLVEFDALNALGYKRIWVIDTSGFTPGYTRGYISKSHWDRIQTEQFWGVYSFEGAVTVTQFERKDAFAESSDTH
jgi:mannosyltransferase